MSEVAKFYDNFSSHQVHSGINNRHISILNQLESAGIRSAGSILEVGCGVGPVSELLLRRMPKRCNLHAVDISPQSIEYAKRLMLKYPNVSFEVKDFCTELLNKKFDAIVLPDVIEHIPWENYPSFFTNLFSMLSDDGFIFIHIPDPNYLEWLIENGSGNLQIIDHPVYTDKLLGIIYPIGFYIHYLKSYSIYTVDNDYQVIVLKKKIDKGFSELRVKPFQLHWILKLSKQIQYLLRGFK